MEKTSVTEEDVAESVDEILMNADNALCEELRTEFSVRVSVLILIPTTFCSTMCDLCIPFLLSKGTIPQVLIQRGFPQINRSVKCKLLLNGKFVFHFFHRNKTIKKGKSCLMPFAKP